MSDSKMHNNYLISFKTKDYKFRTYNEKTKKLVTYDVLPMDINKFVMLTGDDKDATDEDLIAYAKEFKVWNRELRFNKIFSFRYSECYLDSTAVTRAFNSRCNYKDHDQISPTEYYWMQKSPNYGIQYLSKKDYTRKCYSYDFKNQYALSLNSTEMLPTKQGKEYTLDKLPSSDNLKHGFYNVEIECKDEQFKSVFAFSSHHVYHSISLKYAMKHKKQFNVSISLVCKPDKANAYLYRTKDLVTFTSITNRWFTELTNLRKVYPKNRLIKHLLSSAWGHINAKNTINKTLQEMKDENLIVGMSDKADYETLDYFYSDDKEYWKLLNKAKPYKYNIRVKSWITAISRNMTADICMHDIDNVVRVHTDSISFKNVMTFENVNLILEDKTTGKIHWQDCNRYHNKTTGYKTKGYKD
jgi:hypothetical protein